MAKKKSTSKRELPPNVNARDNGKYQVKFSRKGHKINRLFDNLDSAARYALDTRIAIDAGDYQDGKKERETTLCDLCDLYEKKRTPEKKGAKQEKSNLHLIRREEWAKFPVKSVRSKHIADYRNRRVKEGKAPSTINNIMNLVSSIFTWAITEQNYDLINPVTGLKRVPANPGRDVRFVMAELSDFLHECEEEQSGYWWLIYFIKLQLLTAMRQGEVRRLRWQDLKKTSQGYAWHLPKTKNGEARDVPLLPEAEAVMHALKEVSPKHPNGWVFGDPNLLASEGGISTDLVTRVHREAAERSDYKGRLTNHDLRHISCTMLAKFYPNALALSKVTGHKTLQMLARYYNQTVDEMVAELHLGQRNRKRLEEEDRKTREDEVKKEAERVAALEALAVAAEEERRKMEIARDSAQEMARFYQLRDLRALPQSAARNEEIARLEAETRAFHEKYPDAAPSADLVFEEKLQDISDDNVRHHEYREHLARREEQRQEARKLGLDDDDHL